MPSVEGQPPPVSGPQAGYWRSLNDLQQTAEFRAQTAQEFPGLAETLSASRRQFLKFAGISAAAGAMAGCRWPRETILPFSERPSGRVPGVPEHYASVIERGGVARGIVVTSYDGRPIKIEGNPLHPGSFGATDIWTQACILDLYDPDRSQQALTSDGTRRTSGSFATFAAAHFAELRRNQGAGLRVLAEPSSSPTLQRLRKQFAATLPQAQWVEYEPISADAERAGLVLAFGKPYRPFYQLDKADVVLSLDADLLNTHPAGALHARQFAQRRTADDAQRSMLRLYTVESGVSLTGSNADERFAVRPSEMPAVLLALAHALAQLGANVQLPRTESAPSPRFAFVQRIAADLFAAKGKVVIAAGPSQSAETHALAHLLNFALGAAGTSVHYLPVSDADRRPHAAAIAALTSELRSGAVQSLLILGGNPAYDAPADLKFAEAIGKAPVSIHLSDYDNETSQRCTWHVPRAHSLEAWGDARAFDGTVAVAQPLIEPLFGGRSAIELVALLVGETNPSGYALVQQTFKETFKGDGFQIRWERALHDGVIAGSAIAHVRPELASGAWAAAKEKMTTAAAAARVDGFELAFQPDNRLLDGGLANNAWLQELPDPLTKLTWDNAALLAPATARKLGVDRDGRWLEISAGGATLRIPAMVLPGHAPDVITLPLGYGRTACGVIGQGAGFDAYVLRTSSNLWSHATANVILTDGLYELVTTQDQHAIRSEVGAAAIQQRLPALFREGTLDEYRHYLDAPVDDTVQQQRAKGKNFAYQASHHTVHVLPLVQPFEPQQFPGKPRWAMAIDLTKCTGCAACVIACQAENNIPVVGKGEVAVGREMHWIRIDRYFRGDPDAPQFVHQPLTCHHCENAPCEQVCPVAATVHDQEGLNVMVYNRCIGTRYCSNNCPYKVRRFNWFYNHHGPRHPRSLAEGTIGFPSWEKPSLMPQKLITEIEILGHNPEVTVRSRGVMEKCTFCVQRIASAKIHARNEQVSPGIEPGRPAAIADGAFTTACAQACPSEAIVFGDLATPGSRVSKLHKHDRAYAMLEELNVRPRLKYLTRLRNAPAAHNGHESDHGAPGAEKGHA